MRVAIIADWLYTFGGAEHVLAQLHTLFPDAPIFTTIAKPESLGPLKNADIRTTWLQNVYRLTRNHQVLLPLMPKAMESIDLTGFDLVISSSHAVGKGIIVPPSALHICYCHTPMRYAWEMEDEYLHDFGIPKILQSPIRKQLAKLRRWDLTTAQRTDVFIANSSTTQERIKRIYRRESLVISPPVEDRFFAKMRNERGEMRNDETPINQQLATSNQQLGTRHSAPVTSRYYLAVGRLVPYKRFDLLIQCANELNIPLVIAGKGQDEARLKKLAGPTVTFLGYVPDDELSALYGNATTLLFPQFEDAGIAPLEAQACGTPVIAYAKGGALDAVKDGTTGLFFSDQTVESVREALQRFETKTWNKDAIRAHAKEFSEEIFRKKLMEEVTKKYEAFKEGKFKRH